MTLLATLLGRIGLPEQYRRIVLIVLLASAVLVALALLKRGYDRGVIARHQAQLDVRASAARNAADVERVRDAATTSANQKDLDHAIDIAPRSGTLSPAAHALACERLRKLGRVPPTCRAGSAD